MRQVDRHRRFADSSLLAGYRYRDHVKFPRTAAERIPPPPHRKFFLQQSPAFNQPPMRRHFLLHTAAVILLATCLTTMPACRKPPAAEPAKASHTELPDWLKRNRLAATPSGFIQRHAQAPVLWQPWTKETITTATESNRLLFLFVGSPVYPSSDETLATIYHSPQAVADINDGTVIPILADGEANRELGRLIAVLSAEIRRPVAYPFLVWLSPQGNPIAWLPIDSKKQANFLSLFSQSSSMVVRMWKESPDYVVSNSAKDAELRQQRITVPKPTTSPPAPLDRLTRSTRSLCDRYNSETADIDGSGGLFPCSSIEFLASAAHSSALPAPLRADATKVTEAMIDAILASPMVDPLDGGIFSARRGIGWNLPSFNRDTSTQARTSLAFLAAWHAKPNPRTLKAALAALDFTHSGLGTGQNKIVHSVSCPQEHLNSFLWTLEDLKNGLEPSEFEILSSAMGVRSLGNIPPENNNAQLFRLNTLAWQRPTPPEAAPAIESARGKLLKIRAQRLTDLPVETTVYARNLARLASAHAAAFAATGEPAHLQQASSLLSSLRENYDNPNRGLRQNTAEADPSFTSARALDYVLAVHAAIDLHNVTLDQTWIAWAEELLDHLATRFVVDDTLMECEPGIAPVDFKMSDHPMLFEESSVHLAATAIQRMSFFGRAPSPALTEVANRILASETDNPIVRADLLATEAACHLHPLVKIPGNPQIVATFRPAIQKIHPRFVTVVVLPADNPATSVTITFPGPAGKTTTVTTPEQLTQALVPTPITGP